MVCPQIFNDFDMLYGYLKPFKVRLRYSDEPGARSRPIEDDHGPLSAVGCSV